MRVIVLENVPENAVVEVDCDKITVTPSVNQLLTIETKAGKHVVVVKRGTQVFMAESVDVEVGKHLMLNVRAALGGRTKPGNR